MINDVQNRCLNAGLTWSVDALKPVALYSVWLMPLWLVCLTRHSQILLSQRHPIVWSRWWLETWKSWWWLQPTYIWYSLPCSLPSIVLLVDTVMEAGPSEVRLKARVYFWFSLKAVPDLPWFPASPARLPLWFELRLSRSLPQKA